MPSDLLFPAPRLNGGFLGAHQVNNKRRHSLPTQHAQQARGVVSALEWNSCGVRDGEREGPPLPALHRVMKLAGSCLSLAHAHVEEIVRYC